MLQEECTLSPGPQHWGENEDVTPRGANWSPHGCSEPGGDVVIPRPTQRPEPSPHWEEETLEGIMEGQPSRPYPASPFNARTTWAPLEGTLEAPPLGEGSTPRDFGGELRGLTTSTRALASQDCFGGGSSMTAQIVGRKLVWPEQPGVPPSPPSLLRSGGPGLDQGFDQEPAELAGAAWAPPQGAPVGASGENVAGKNSAILGPEAHTGAAPTQPQDRRMSFEFETDTDGGFALRALPQVAVRADQGSNYEGEDRVEDEEGDLWGKEPGGDTPTPYLMRANSPPPSHWGEAEAELGEAGYCEKVFEVGSPQGGSCTGKGFEGEGNEDQPATLHGATKHQGAWDPMEGPAADPAGSPDPALVFIGDHVHHGSTGAIAAAAAAVVDAAAATADLAAAAAATSAAVPDMDDHGTRATEGTARTQETPSPGASQLSGITAGAGQVRVGAL